MTPAHGRRRRRRGRRAAVVGFVLLLGALGWTGVRALAAQSHLDAARTSLEAARAAAAERRDDEAAASLDAAGQDTADARALTGDPVWTVLAAVPWAGNTLETARALAVAADDLARDVLPTALRGAQQARPEDLRALDGSIDVDLIKDVAPALVASAEGVTDVETDLADVPDRAVLGRVAAARDELRTQVADLADTLRGAATAVRLAPALLGDDRPRRYALVVQQTAEARGTGGLPGGWAILEADAGRLRVAETGSNADAPDGAIAVPEDVSDAFIARYRPLGAFDLWVNSNVSPDLPSVARVFAQRFEQLRGLPVDGVIALDAQALATILEGGEPLTLATGRQLPVDQLVEYLAVGQYADFTADPGSDVLSRADERREGLADVAAQTAQRVLASGDTSALLRGLSEALQSGHLRMASDDPALALLAEAGVDGSLPAQARPIAYPVVVGATAGKLDHFLDRSVRYEAGDCTSAYRDSRITVTLTNRAPASGLPPYVTVRQALDGSIGQSTDNAVTLSVYASRGATLTRATLDGVELDPEDPSLPLLTRFVEGGLPAWALPVELPREQPRELVLELREPLFPGKALVPEQPLSRPLTTEVDVPVC